MRPIIALIAALLTAVPASAACRSSASTNTTDELKILVPFAVPIGLPVATFAPYFYSAAQFQPPRASNPAPTSTDNEPLTTDKSPSNSDLVATHCSSCHAGPSPKAGLSLDHPDFLSLTDRLHAIRAVASGQMPKGSQLTENEIRALIQELTSVGQVSNLPSQR